MAEGKKCISWDQPAEKGKVQSRMRPARHFNSAHGLTVAISGPWTMVHCAALTVGLFIILCNAPWSSSHPKYDPPAHSVKADTASDQKGRSESKTVDKNIYSGPSFEAFNCYADKNPERLSMPSACKDRRGKPAYATGTKMTRFKVALFQAATMRKFEGRFCRVERSSTAMLCGTEDWTSVLSPPVIGDVEVLSGPACQQLWNTRQYTDTAYHKKFAVKAPGVTVYAYTARGTLQTSGQSIYCYGSTGRVLKGDVITNSMVFLSYRVTLGTFEARRQVHRGEFGGRDSVITAGPLAGVGFKEEEVSGGFAILGSVTLIMGKSYDDHTCPLSKIRDGLDMYVIPHPGKKPGTLSTHPGDEVYSLNRMSGWLSHQHGGTPPARRQNYTLLVTGAQDLVLNLGNERKMPAVCGNRRYMETSHRHVLATLGEEGQEEDIRMLPLDLDLVQTSSEYSARLDLLAFIVQVTLQGARGTDICVGNHFELASLLEKAAELTREGSYRLIPAGESIFRVFCPRMLVGSQWIGEDSGNCSEFLPVRRLEGAELEGPQYFLTPNARYLARSPGKRQCSGMPSSYLGNDGIYYIWDQGALLPAHPQPSREADLNSLLISGLPDVTGKVAEARELYTSEEEERAIARLDFGVYLQGAATTDVLRTQPAVDVNEERAGSAGNRPYVLLPGISVARDVIDHPAMTPLLWIYDKIGLPMWHFLLSLGSLCGMIGGLFWVWGAFGQCRELSRLGATLKGSSTGAKGFDLLSLSTSARARAKRIRELEVSEAEGRILRAQAKARAFSLTSLHEAPGRIRSTNSLQV